MPNVIASEICSVQPMMVDMINPFTKKWQRIGMDMPANKWVYNIRSQEIKTWIESQPIYMWKFYDINVTQDTPISAMLGDNYVFTEEMESWFQLRWG